MEFGKGHDIVSFCPNFLDPEFLSSLKKEKAGLIVWLDLMKFGRLSVGDLNHTTELLHRILAAFPEDACGFLIAPQLTSERRSCLRDEWRIGGYGYPNIICQSMGPTTQSDLIYEIMFLSCLFSVFFTNARRVEDKLDARKLAAESVNIRCDLPPSSKRVAITFPAWVVFQHGCQESNAWGKSLIIQDKI